MKEINLKGMGERVYFDLCDNGLPIYIWQSKKTHSFQGVLTVFYGADGLDYSVKRKAYHVHRGSAHYLEHIMCEANDGESVLSKFNRLGSSSNAHTHYKHTSFEFSGTKQLKENIVLLLKSIFEKEFHEKEVEHERTPILEEKRRRQDDPGVIAFVELNKMLFHKYPNQTDLIGSEEDIQTISLEELRQIYTHFYHPQNMAFVVTGNVDPYEVVTIVKEYFKDKPITIWQKPVMKNYKEGKRVSSKREIISTNVEIPEVTIAAKIPFELFKKYDELKVINIMRLLIASNFGSTSLFKENLLEKKLLTNLGFSIYRLYDYYVFEISCRTKFPEEVEPILIDKLKHLEISKDDILRKIKSSIATLVLSYEDIFEVNSILTNELVYGGYVVDNLKGLLETITMDDINAVYNLLSFRELCSLILLPNE